jgi:hypothetical protein
VDGTHSLSSEYKRENSEHGEKLASEALTLCQEPWGDKSYRKEVREQEKLTLCGAQTEEYVKMKKARQETHCLLSTEGAIYQDMERVKSERHAPPVEHGANESGYG